MQPCVTRWVPVGKVHSHFVAHLVNGGLDPEDSQLLFASRRSGEIASLAVLGLARLRETGAKT